MRTTALVTALLLAATAGCAPPRAAAGGAQGPLVSSLQVRPENGEVGFVLQVTNASDRAVQLTYPTGQSYDFVVLRDGEELWRWSADRMFTQAVREESLAPGETLTHQASWRPPAGARGEFTARGVLTAADSPVEQRAVFRLP